MNVEGAGCSWGRNVHEYDISVVDAWSASNPSRVYDVFGSGVWRSEAVSLGLQDRRRLMGLLNLWIVHATLLRCALCTDRYGIRVDLNPHVV